MEDVDVAHLVVHDRDGVDAGNVADDSEALRVCLCVENEVGVPVDCQTVLQDFRCADALAGPHKPFIGLFDVPMHSRTPKLQDFRCAAALTDPHKPSIGLFDVPMHSRTAKPCCSTFDVPMHSRTPTNHPCQCIRGLQTTPWRRARPRHPVS